MATEKGIVTRVDEQTAWVKTVRSKSCEHCASRGSCTATGQDMTVAAVNRAQARTGDRVMIRMETGLLLKATFLLYLVPVLSLLAGAVAGQRLSGHMGWDESATAALAGFAALALAMIFVRRRGRGLERQERYRPQVVRVMRPTLGEAGSDR